MPSLKAPAGKTPGTMIADDGKEYPRRIAEAVGVVAADSDPERAGRIEAAMSLAVKKAYDQGITDPAEIRKLIIAARDEAMKE